MARNFVSLFTLLGLAAGLSAQSITMVQPKEFFMLRPDVQKEIGLTAEQVKQVKIAAGDTVVLTPEGKLQVRITQDSGPLDEIAAKMAKVANEKQLLRLEEIWVQRNGAFVLGSPTIAKRLNLSTSQNTKIKEILSAFGEELREKAMSSGGRLDMTQLEDLKSGFAKQLNATLSKDQLHQLESLKGKPFKFSAS